MRTWKHLKSFALIGAVLAIGPFSCTAAETSAPRFAPSSAFVNCYCVNNRSARSPAAYYTSDAGRKQVRVHLTERSEDAPMFQIDIATMKRVSAIACSSDNQVEDGKVNFYIRFFDDRGKTISHGLSRDKLKEIIDTLPEAVKADLLNMYQHG